MDPAPATDTLRPPRRVRRLQAMGVVVVLAVLVGAFWWNGDGQQRRRAVAGLGDLPAVTRAGTSDADARRVLVRLREDATQQQVVDVIRRAGEVADDDRFPVVEVLVSVGSAYTRVDDGEPSQDARALAGHAAYLVALRRVPGSADVEPDRSVLLRRTGNPSVPTTGSLDQVLAALRLMDAAGLPVPQGLSGYGQLDITGSQVGPAVLARALRALRPLVRAGLEPAFVRGDLVNLDIDDDLSPAQVRRLLATTAQRLRPVRSDGRPVIARLYAEYPDRRSEGIGADVR